MRLRFLLPLSATAALFASTALADMGRVMVNRVHVQVGEDAQKAVILHNGQEEVLILGTELKATARAPIIRFLPFPAEPQVRLAPAATFDRLGAIVKKYGLAFHSRWMTKGGAGSRTEAVRVVATARLGAHDLTIVKVQNAGKFRAWVNAHFRRKGLRTAKRYPAEEAIVADYVARGLDYFVLDYVELPAGKRLVEPIAYRFKSNALYYPLKTSNSFGGKGEIDLFIVAPRTLCVPGSNDPVGYFKGEDFDLAVPVTGEPARKCLDLPLKASTSARLVPEERDLAGIYPEWQPFFGPAPIFIQAMRYVGSYDFKQDILVPLAGTPKALGSSDPLPSHPSGIMSGLRGIGLSVDGRCSLPPKAGPCKGRFDGYSFDPAEQACKRFTWGGCGPAPFTTREECEKACIPR